MLNLTKAVLLFLFFFSIGSSVVFGQDDRDSRTPSQRLQLLSQRIDAMERSINSAISAVRADEKDKKKDKKSANLDSPLVRLNSIKKDLNNLDGDIGSLKSKVDRAEKYESEDITNLEDRVAEIQPVVDRALGETASARLVADSGSGDKKKKVSSWESLEGAARMNSRSFSVESRLVETKNSSLSQLVKSEKEAMK